MKKIQITAIGFAAVVLTVLGGMALAQQDKYTLKVPGGLAFSEFRGYEGWHLVSISQDGPLVAAILADPVMIAAYKQAFPGRLQDGKDPLDPKKVGDVRRRDGARHVA